MLKSEERSQLRVDHNVTYQGLAYCWVLHPHEPQSEMRPCYHH